MAGDYVFGWARSYDADQLAAFIEDLWSAAGQGDDLAALDAIEQAIARHRPEPVPCPLTQRQIDILTEFASGETYDSVASNLGISPNTVRTHCNYIHDKLGSKSRSHAVAIATRFGWLSDVRLPVLPEKTPRRKAPEGASAHQRTATWLRQQPGIELAVGTYASRYTANTTASAVRGGIIPAYRPAGAFQARRVRASTGQWTVLARYVGQPTTAQSTEEAPS